MPNEEPGLAYHCCIAFIGFCCLTSSSISLTMAALYMSGERPTYSDTGQLENNFGEVHLLSSIVIDILGAVCDIALLLAVTKQLPPLVLSWVVMAPLRGVGQLVIAIVVCVKYHSRSSMVYVDAVFTGIFLMCLVFFANVCYNYFRVMRAKNRRQARAEARWRAEDERLGSHSAGVRGDRRPRESASNTSWITEATAGSSRSSIEDEPQLALGRLRRADSVVLD